MRAMIFCVVAMLLASCHTQKQTTTATKVVETTESEARQETFIAMLDSIRNTLNFTADSVVVQVPTVVAINGKDSVVNGSLTLHKPHVTNVVDIVNKRQIDSSLSLDVHTSNDSITDTQVTTDNVVVAEPISWGWLWWVCGIAIIVIAYMAWQKYK